MLLTKRILAAVALLAMISGVATAQVWVETGDAPDGVPTRQDTVGVGPLSSITGVLDRPAGDHVDTFSIVITDPQQFLAATNDAFGGSAVNDGGFNEDTRLWLWDTDGNVVLGNDDVGDVGTNTLSSMISDPSTFGSLSGGELVDPTAANISLTAGKYLLSISEFANDPEDAANVDLVDMGADFDALHGPNPSAGPFDHWENLTDSDIITYDIALRGATYCEQIPEPASLMLGFLGMISVLGIARRS